MAQQSCNSLSLMCTSRSVPVFSVKYCHQSSSHCIRFMTSTTNEGDPEIPNNSKNEDSVKIARTLAKSQCPTAGSSLQTPAGLLFKKDSIVDRGRRQKAYELEQLLPKDSDNLTEVVQPMSSEFFIPQVKLHMGDGSERKRVLV